jgi:hypothetical protein
VFLCRPSRSRLRWAWTPGQLSAPVVSRAGPVAAASGPGDPPGRCRTPLWRADVPSSEASWTRSPSLELLRWPGISRATVSGTVARVWRRTLPDDPASSSSSACRLRRSAGCQRGWCRYTVFARLRLSEGPLGNNAGPAHACTRAQGEGGERRKEHRSAGNPGIHRLLPLKCREGSHRRRPARPRPGRRATGAWCPLCGGPCRTFRGTEASITSTQTVRGGHPNEPRACRTASLVLNGCAPAHHPMPQSRSIPEPGRPVPPGHRTFAPCPEQHGRVLMSRSGLPTGFAVARCSVGGVDQHHVHDGR